MSENENENKIILPENLNIPTKYAVLMYNIVSVVSKRGGFNADEFTPIGELVDFLKKELKIGETPQPEDSKNLPTVPE